MKKTKVMTEEKPPVSVKASMILYTVLVVVRYLVSAKSNILTKLSTKGPLF